MKLLKYLIVGGVAAIIDIGLFSFLTWVTNLHWFPVSMASFCIATLVNYYLSISHVFQSGSRFKKHHEVLLVFIVSAIALIVNQCILYILIEKLVCNLILAKISATGIVFFWNYFGRSNLVFKAKKS